MKESGYALNCTRLSCHRFIANQVRLALFILAYNLGNFMRRLALRDPIKHRSLRGVHTKLIKRYPGTASELTTSEAGAMV